MPTKELIIYRTCLPVIETALYVVLI